jgi:hypothetical protein
MPSAVTILIAEADRLIDDAALRIGQYQRHAEELRRAGRDSEGAREVLDRMQASLARLRTYRDGLGRDERTAGPEGAGAREHTRRRSKTVGFAIPWPPVRRPPA